MGAFIIFEMEFKDKRSRTKFEKKYKIRKQDILVDEYANSYGFSAWAIDKPFPLYAIYYMGFMGYAEPEDVLKKCLKEKINIKFMAWIPINDRQAEWEKIRGRY